jgi:FAD binding domain/Berberine and berberine like
MSTVTGFESELRARVSGELVLPGDRKYDEARAVYNGVHDRRPAAIVRAAGTEDVAAAVIFARHHDLPLAVRGGGHGVAGFATCDGGVVIDLGGMRRVDVDAERRLARAEGGCTWGDFNDATHAFGLATTGGVVSTTGIAGLTLGGGLGYLSRTFGFSCDNLTAAEVVTAEGEVVTCSESRDEDLFWALRGGGGNFGVVTSFEYRLHPVAEIWGGPIFFPLDGKILRDCLDFVAQAPEQLGAIFGLAPTPPVPFVPEEWHGRPAIGLIACWTGPLEEGEEALRPLEEWPILGRGVGPMPYPVINTLFDELLPPGLRHYWKTLSVRDIPEAAAGVHIEHGARVPTVESGVFFFPLDGAPRRVRPADTALGFRDSALSIVITAAWHELADDQSNVTWVRDYYDALRPYAHEDAYVNFLAADDQGGVRAAYGDNYDRLAEVKRRYDPENLFRLNQNIRPAADGGKGAIRKET